MVALVVAEEPPLPQELALPIVRRSQAVARSGGDKLRDKNRLPQTFVLISFERSRLGPPQILAWCLVTFTSVSAVCAHRCLPSRFVEQTRSQKLWNDADIVLWEISRVQRFASPIVLVPEAARCWTLVPHLQPHLLQFPGQRLSRPRGFKFPKIFCTDVADGSLRVLATKRSYCKVAGVPAPTVLPARAPVLTPTNEPAIGDDVASGSDEDVASVAAGALSGSCEVEDVALQFEGEKSVSANAGAKLHRFGEVALIEAWRLRQLIVPSASLAKVCGLASRLVLPEAEARSVQRDLDSGTTVLPSKEALRVFSFKLDILLIYWERVHASRSNSLRYQQADSSPIHGLSFFCVA